MKNSATSRVSKLFGLCICVFALCAFAGAQSAVAKTVVLEPCASGSNNFFGPWGGPTTFQQWAIETRCPSELSFAPIPGKTLGASVPGYYFPATSAAHGTFTSISFDFLGGNGSDTGVTQGVKACRVNQTACGPLVTPASDDVTSPEHHEMTLANSQVPAGSTYLYVIGSCPTAPATQCSPSRDLVIRDLSITVDDTTPPTIAWSATASGEATIDDDGNEVIPTTGVPIARDAWNTGLREIRVRATDVGVGVKVVDYELHRDDLVSGAIFREPALGCGNTIYITTSIPSLCALTLNSIHAIPLGQAGSNWGMGQGLNHGNLSATDAAGNISTPLSFDFKIDTIRPIVKSLEVTPHANSKWQGDTRIGLEWINDGEQSETDTESGVVKAHFKATSDDPGVTDFVQGDVVGEPDTVIDSVSLIDLPGAGKWNVVLTTIDKAGNSSLPVSAQVWVDPNVPAKPVINPIGLLSGGQLAAGVNATWSAPANAGAITSGICNYAVAVDQSAHTDPDHLVPGTKLLEKLSPVLPGGSNYVHVRAISCAGAKSEISDLEFQVDTQAPSAVVTAPGPGGWYSAQFPFAASLAGTPEPGTLLSVAIDGGPDAWSSAAVVPLPLPDGAHSVSLKVKDVAGNQALQLLPVKSDSTKPSIGFSAFDPAHPALVRATGSDAHSGVHEASMQYRAAGTGDWHSLGDVVRPAGGGAAAVELSAGFPDAALPAGAYELQLKASDVAGNESVAHAFADGSPAVVKLPLRAAPLLTAGFAATIKSKRCTGKGKRKKCRSVATKSAAIPIRDSVLVGYGAGETLSGVLTAANGEPIANGELQIFESVGGGSPQLLKEMTSGPAGEYSLAIAPGPSRLLTVRFAGNDTSAPAFASAKFLSKAKITLSLARVKTAHGWKIRFSGRVFASGATIPTAGKAVRLQFNTKGGWDEFPVLATDRDGRFKYARNFKSTGHAIGYRFRALVPWADGWVYEAGKSSTESIVLK